MPPPALHRSLLATGIITTRSSVTISAIVPREQAYIQGGAGPGDSKSLRGGAASAATIGWSPGPDDVRDAINVTLHPLVGRASLLDRIFKSTTEPHNLVCCHETSLVVALMSEGAEHQYKTGRGVDGGRVGISRLSKMRYTEPDC